MFVWRIFTSVPLLLVVVVCLSQSASGKTMGNENVPYRSIDLQDIYETQLLQVKTVVSTHVVSVGRTLVVYPTCTAVAPGVPPCHTGNASPVLSSDTSHLQSHLPAEVVPEQREQTHTEYNVMEVVLPSCDCGGSGGVAARGHYRSPRLLQKDLAITIKTTSTSTVEATTISTNTATTVSITYGGCVPADAISTTACPFT